MPIRRIEAVALPYAGKRHTPNTGALAALYTRGGDALAEISLRKGAASAQLFERLGQIFTGYQQMEREKQSTAAALELRAREKAEERAFAEEQARLEREARTTERQTATTQRASERAADQAIRSAERAEDATRATTAAERAQLERDVSATRPGVVSPALFEQVKRLSPSMATRFQVQDGAPVLLRTPEQTRQAELDAAAATERQTDNTRADRQLAATIAASQQRGESEPLVPIVGPDGKTRYGTRTEARGNLVPSGQNKPATGLEKRALNFFNRAQQADVDVEGMEKDVQGMGLAGQTYMEWAPNFAQTDIGQRYRQAQRAFTEARLRKDSGAAIPEQEFKNDAQTYFAQPGDSEATLKQKRRGRAAVLASLGFEAGQALGEFLGDAAEAQNMVQGYRQRAAADATVDQVPQGTLKPGQTVTVGGFTVTVKP